jgi:hypothetical protein
LATLGWQEFSTGPARVGAVRLRQNKGECDDERKDSAGTHA